MLLIRNEPLSRVTGYENYEEVNGPLTLSLTSFSVGNTVHALLEEEAIIEAFDGREYRIKQMKENKVSKSIEAVSTFFDLGGHQKDSIYGGTRTFKQFADWLFAGTGWTYEAGDVTGSKLIPNYGNDNFLKLLEVLLSTYECERQILPGKRVRFAKKLGPDRDAQYRYGHNIKALSRSVDTTSLYTSIKGYGGNGLVVTYTSPNAAKFPHAGEQEPIRDERFTVASSFTERLRQELNDTPKVAIELDALELVEKELGERVWLIYEPLQIEFQTRILAKTTRIPAEKSSAVIGNAMPKKMTDALTDTNVKIDEHDKQNQSKFEQTNERFTIEVERLDGDIVGAYNHIDITADATRAEIGAVKIELEHGIADSISVIEQTALSIRQEVNTSIEGIDGRVDTLSGSITTMGGQIALKADASTVTSLGSSISALSIELDAVSGEISSIVSFTDVTGQQVASKINQSATTVKIQAEHIVLEGITRVADVLELGLTNNGQLKGIKLNGDRAAIYSSGDSLTLSASFLLTEALIEARHPYFGTNLPAVLGTSSNQRVAMGVTAAGRLRVYTAGGVGYEYNPDGYL